MIGFPLGLLYANAGEWLVHKYLLHGLGRDKKSFWAFHWHEHHRMSRQDGFRDAHYEQSLLSAWNGQSKEALMLSLAAASHLPLLPVAPFFTAGVLYSILRYYRVHKRGHMDPEWARDQLPWHYDHHMGPNQNRNWCVTFPWWDIVMGTRVPYAGTSREERDRAARKARAMREQPAPAAA